MRPYNGKKLFRCNGDENVTNALTFFDTPASMSNFTPQEMLAGMPLMLSRNAFELFDKRADDCTSNEESKTFSTIGTITLIRSQES